MRWGAVVRGGRVALSDSRVLDDKLQSEEH